MLGFSTLTSNLARPIALFAATVANAAGSGAGASVTVTVNNIIDSFGDGLLPSDTDYVVNALASQPATVTVSGKTASGFTLTLAPISSGTTLAAGTIDVMVMA
jgi:hypothetical protein